MDVLDVQALNKGHPGADKERGLCLVQTSASIFGTCIQFLQYSMCLDHRLFR